MKRWCFVFGVLCLSAQLAKAQTKLSGAGQCAKPHSSHVVTLSDRPDHSFSLNQVRCRWSRPFQIEGVEAKGGTAVQFDEITGNTSRFQGYYIDVMANGDEAHYRYQGNMTVKDGVPTTSWTWTLSGGTGKLRNVEGQGTCNGTGKPDGSGVWECQGEYRAVR